MITVSCLVKLVGESRGAVKCRMPWKTFKNISQEIFWVVSCFHLFRTSLANIWIWSPSCITAGSPRIHSRRSGGSRIGFDAESKTHGFCPGTHSSSGPAAFELVLDNLSLFGSKEPKVLTKSVNKHKCMLPDIIILFNLNSLTLLSHNCGLATQSFRLR